jgi:hypothetical protein
MNPNNITPLHQNPRLSAALAYASIGWHILPCWWAVADKCACGNHECKSPGKHPIAKLAPWGQNSATTDAEKIKAWWQQYPDANIAAYLEPSSLVAIDIDPRNGGLQTIEDIEAKHGALQSDLMQFTGGGGEHRVFSRPSNTQMPGKLGNGVDVKANGYIMLEPSNHVSGGSYAWEASSDPRDGVMASPLPDWLRDLAAPKPVGSPDEPVQGRVMPIGEDTKAELIEALQVIPADSRDIWLKVGMALQSIGDPNWAFEIWDGWSAQSKKYDRVDQTRVWRSFKAKGLDGLTYKTIFAMAKELGVVVIPMNPAGSQDEPVPAESINIRKMEEQHPVDPSLLVPPGILRDVTDWVNQTARKPQPQFAVQTAIAFAGAVLGRRFKTDHGNWASLYLLNIGLSASGKEYAKEALETLLEACGLSHIIGPSGYSSDSGLMSSLHAQPNQATVIDEFHRVLEQASIKGNARSQGMVRALIEAWGRTNGVMRSVGYSTVGATAAQVAALQGRDVANPSLTLLAMSIPSFWETIGSAAAKDGFLNRFLIVETTIGRQVGQFNGSVPVPQSVIDWATQTRARYTGLVDPDTSPVGVPAVVVGIDPAAMALFTQFSHECITLMDAHDADGLAEMFGRSNEMAMKLAMILALGRSAATVSAADAEWAIQYVKTYALRAVYRLKTCMADGEFEAAKKQVIHLILMAAEHGMTVRELNTASRRFRGMTQRQQVELLNSMAFVGEIQQVTFQPESGRGKPRQAWVAVEAQND